MAEASSVQSIFEAPYERHGVAVPGLPILPRGVERHPIPGGNSRAIHIQQGNEICVLDRERLQPVELAFFARNGSSNAGMIGARGGQKAESLQRRLLQGDRSGKKVPEALDAAGFDSGRADAVRVFAAGSRAGDTETFHADREGLLLICAAGSDMSPDAQDAPTEIVLYVRKANPEEEREIKMPPLLADPLADVNILPGQARSYKVRKGQYIQILDVQGRGCSDFQAFSLRSLEVGEITSAVKSPILGKVIGLARMDVTHSKEGTRVEVGKLDGHQKRLSALVTAIPHFDPEKGRVKGQYP